MSKLCKECNKIAILINAYSYCGIYDIDILPKDMQESAKDLYAGDVYRHKVTIDNMIIDYIGYKYGESRLLLGTSGRIIYDD